MYIIIWPEDRLVLSRIIKVNGRISCEKISTRGKKSIKPTGDPKGSMWAKKAFNWVIDTQIIKGIQKRRLTEKVSL